MWSPLTPGAEGSPAAARGAANLGRCTPPPPPQARRGASRRSSRTAAPAALRNASHHARRRRTSPGAAVAPNARSRCRRTTSCSQRSRDAGDDPRVAAVVALGTAKYVCAGAQLLRTRASKPSWHRLMWRAMTLLPVHARVVTAAHDRSRRSPIVLLAASRGSDLLEHFAMALGTCHMHMCRDMHSLVSLQSALQHAVQHPGSCAQLGPGIRHVRTEVIRL